MSDPQEVQGERPQRFLQSDAGRLVVLTLTHFIVDFCGGLTIPLPEPTLTQHLGVSLGQVAMLIGAFAVLVNVVQPISGLLLPRRGLPMLLVVSPLAAALVACIGLAHTTLGVGAMLLVAGLGIGMFHPEAALAAHSTSRRRRGVGVSLFMSGGYFGYASGSLVAGTWVEYHNQGLSHFWLLAIPALLVALLVRASGLHRLEGHVSKDGDSTDGQLPFFLVLALAVCIAVNMCMLVRFLPIWMVRRFPDQNPQGWAGGAVFATGVAGAIGAFFWGHVSDNRSRGAFVALCQCLCIPFLYGLLYVSGPATAPLWGLGVGVTMGAVFPLSVVLARESRGPAQRLRMGLAIGGAWGLGEVAFMLGGRYVGSYGPGQVEPVAHVLRVCWILVAATGMLALFVAYAERRARMIQSA